MKTGNLIIIKLIFQDPLAGTTWQNIIHVAKVQQAIESSASDINDRTLLLGGCVDGHIVVFDWKNKKNPGKVVLRIEVIVTYTSYRQISQQSVIQESHELYEQIWKQV